MWLVTTLFALLIWLIPFVTSSNIFDSEIYGAQYLSVLTGTVLIILLTIRIYLTAKTTRFQFGNTEISMVLLLLYIGLLFCQKPAYSYSYPHYFLLIAGFIGAQTLRLLNKIFVVAVLITGGFIQAVFCLYQIFFSAQPSAITGSFSNSGILAQYLVLYFIFCLCFYLLHKPNSQWQRVVHSLSLAAGIVIATVLPFTHSRTSLIAAIVGISLVAWSVKKERITTLWSSFNIKWKIIAVTGLSVCTIISSYLLYSFKPESVKGRLLIYKICTKMIWDKPFFGHGLGKFASEYNNYQAEYFQNNINSTFAVVAGNTKAAFNEFLQAGVESGLIGLVLFAGTFVLLFCIKIKPGCEYFAVPAKGALIGIVICCLFSYPMRVLPIAVTTIFLGGLLLAGSQIKYTIYISKLHLRTVGLIASLIAVFVCHLQWQEYHARVVWKQAHELFPQNRQEALSLYQKAYQVLYNDGFFLYNYGSQLIETNPREGTRILEEAKLYLSNNDLYVFLGDGYRALQNYRKAEDCYVFSSLMVPSKFYPRYQLFKLYRDFNQIEKAKTVAKLISNMPVKIPSPTVNFIKTEIDEWLLKIK